MKYNFSEFGQTIKIMEGMAPVKVGDNYYIPSSSNLPAKVCEGGTFRTCHTVYHHPVLRFICKQIIEVFSLEKEDVAFFERE